MKHPTRWFVTLLSIAMAYGLMACETYVTDPADADTLTINGTPVATGTTNAVGATNTIATTTNIIQTTNVETNSTTEPTGSSGESGSSSSTGYIGGDVIYSTPATPATPAAAIHIVNAAQFRNPDGTYSFYNRVFADCDSFASYLSSSVGTTIIVTNCGTSAFP